MQAFANARKDEGQNASPDGNPSLEDIQHLIAQVIEAARVVFQAARKEEFEDIARQADLLRQQLLSARNKLNLVSVRHDASGTIH